MAPKVKPFTISVPDSEIKKLQTKLALTTFPEEVEFSDVWDYGVSLKDIKRLARRWQDGYDWRKREAELNKVPQFTTTVPVDGFGELEIHFIHQRSTKKNAIPLLFVHGWPGVFHEVMKMLPMLVEGEDGGPSFHVVAPSLVNFGFSQAASKPGFGISQHASAYHQVMLALGYDRYVTQGGDWGSIITRALDRLYPDNVLASHLNFISTNPAQFRTPNAEKPVSSEEPEKPLTPFEKVGMARTAWFQKEGSGYFAVQSTKPNTIGFALTDSPVALLAWIYEKLHDWTDAYPWTDDEVLDWISIYAFSRAGAGASVRIYYEYLKTAATDPVIPLMQQYSRVKLGISYFAKDCIVQPLAWARSTGPIVQERQHEAGGHFPAWEKPEVLVEDVRSMFRPGGGCEDVLKSFEA